MEKKFQTIQASNINKLIVRANELGLTKEDVVDIITIPNGYILIYFG